MKIVIFYLWLFLPIVAASQDVSDFRIGASMNQKISYLDVFVIEKNSHLPNVDISTMIGKVHYTLSIGEYSAIQATYNAPKVYFRIQYEVNTKQLFTNEYIQHGFGFGAGFNKLLNNGNVRLSIGALISYLYVNCRRTKLVITPLHVGVSVKINKNGIQ